MNEGGSQTTEWKYLKGEDDFGNVVGTPNDEARRIHNGSTDEVPQQEAAKEAKGKLGLCLPMVSIGSPKNKTKDQRVDPKHNEGR
jgi:hypothetical protein